VLSSLNHSEPDRVPIAVTGIHYQAHKLVKHLGVEEQGVCIRDTSPLVVPEKHLLSRFGGDVKNVAPYQKNIETKRGKNDTYWEDA